MNILVSACLVGICCRYDGGHGYNEVIANLSKRHTLIPICPEQLGGLPTPRPPAELRDGRIVTKSGDDMTLQFDRGAKETLKLGQLTNCTLAILKNRSPSCGTTQIYNGHFSGEQIDGMGITARILSQNNIIVINETDIQMLKALNK